MFTSLFPILTTPDLQRSLHFYRDLLGGAETYRFPDAGPPAFVTLQIGGSSIGIGQAEPATAGSDLDQSGAAGAQPARPFSLWVYADNCDEAVHRLSAAGVRILSQPGDQPWGERVATVSDPDGTEVHVGSAAGAPSANT